ncbi:hypothetical protein [Calothrix sp. NIES-3974]|nr:hypothetical protein [Calothrix sp. NIES-3974]BAZ04445.1 hypothetical protein NIES3974_10840 [Calothrix sp. NIES-3974]
MTRGFTQLAVELIAIAEIEVGEICYGAVTIPGFLLLRTIATPYSL